MEEGSRECLKAETRQTRSVLCVENAGGIFPAEERSCCDLCVKNSWRKVGLQFLIRAVNQAAKNTLLMIMLQ